MYHPRVVFRVDCYLVYDMDKQQLYGTVVIYIYSCCGQGARGGDFNSINLVAERVVGDFFTNDLQHK